MSWSNHLNNCLLLFCFTLLFFCLKHWENLTLPTFSSFFLMRLRRSQCILSCASSHHRVSFFIPHSSSFISWIGIRLLCWNFGYLAWLKASIVERRGSNWAKWMLMIRISGWQVWDWGAVVSISGCRHG